MFFAGMAAPRAFIPRICLKCLSLVLVAGLMVSPAQAALLADLLPAPGQVLALSAPYRPAILRGITINPDNPFRFDFLLQRGDTRLEGAALKDESTTLIKYFLTALTVPEDEGWVNLAPDEKDRIIADAIATTHMGRTMLEQDYLLKQLSSSLTHPETPLGKTFWARVRQQALEQFGTRDIPVDNFNRVWIVADRAVVTEEGNTAFVLDWHLKVLMDEDYPGRQPGAAGGTVSADPQADPQAAAGHELSARFVQQIILPELEREVNQGAHFAPLRQVYLSVILANWFKQRLKESLLGRIYVDQRRTAGVNGEDPAVQQEIYDQYMTAFKQGVYNLIQEDVEPATGQVVPRKYFSGGMQITNAPVQIVSSSAVRDVQPFDQLLTIRAGVEESLAAAGAMSSPAVLRDNYSVAPAGEMWIGDKSFPIEDVSEASRMMRERLRIEEFDGSPGGDRQVLAVLFAENLLKANPLTERDLDEGGRVLAVDRALIRYLAEQTGRDIAVIGARQLFKEPGREVMRGYIGLDISTESPTPQGRFRDPLGLLERRRQGQFRVQIETLLRQLEESPAVAAAREARRQTILERDGEDYTFGATRISKQPVNDNGNVMVTITTPGAKKNGQLLTKMGQMTEEQFQDLLAYLTEEAKQMQLREDPDTRVFDAAVREVADSLVIPRQAETRLGGFEINSRGLFLIVHRMLRDLRVVREDAAGRRAPPLVGLMSVTPTGAFERFAGGRTVIEPLWSWLANQEHMETFSAWVRLGPADQRFSLAVYRGLRPVNGKYRRVMMLSEDDLVQSTVDKIRGDLTELEAALLAQGQSSPMTTTPVVSSSISEQVRAEVLGKVQAFEEFLGRLSGDPDDTFRLIHDERDQLSDSLADFLKSLSGAFAQQPWVDLAIITQGLENWFFLSAEIRSGHIRSREGFLIRYQFLQNAWNKEIGYQPDGAGRIRVVEKWQERVQALKTLMVNADNYDLLTEIDGIIEPDLVAFSGTLANYDTATQRPPSTGREANRREGGPPVSSPVFEPLPYKAVLRDLIRHIEALLPEDPSAEGPDFARLRRQGEDELGEWLTPGIGELTQDNFRVIVRGIEAWYRLWRLSRLPADQAVPLDQQTLREQAFKIWQAILAEQNLHQDTFFQEHAFVTKWLSRLEQIELDRVDQDRWMQTSLSDSVKRIKEQLSVMKEGAMVPDRDQHAEEDFRETGELPGPAQEAVRSAVYHLENDMFAYLRRDRRDLGSLPAIPEVSIPGGISTEERSRAVQAFDDIATGLQDWVRLAMGVRGKDQGIVESLGTGLKNIWIALDAEMNLGSSWVNKMAAAEKWQYRLYFLRDNLRVWEPVPSLTIDQVDQALAGINKRMDQLVRAPIPPKVLAAKALVAMRALGITSLVAMTKALVMGRDKLKDANFDLSEDDMLGELSFPVKFFHDGIFLAEIRRLSGKSTDEILQILRRYNVLTFVPMLRAQRKMLEKAQLLVDGRAAYFKGSWNPENVRLNILPLLIPLAAERGMTPAVLIGYVAERLQTVQSSDELDEEDQRVLAILKENIRMEDNPLADDEILLSIVQIALGEIEQTRAVVLTDQPAMPDPETDGVVNFSLSLPILKSEIGRIEALLREDFSTERDLAERLVLFHKWQAAGQVALATELARLKAVPDSVSKDAQTRFRLISTGLWSYYEFLRRRAAIVENDIDDEKALQELVAIFSRIGTGIMQEFDLYVGSRPEDRHAFRDKWLDRLKRIKDGAQGGFMGGPFSVVQFLIMDWETRLTDVPADEQEPTQRWILSREVRFDAGTLRKILTSIHRFEKTVGEISRQVGVTGQSEATNELMSLEKTLADEIRPNTAREVFLTVTKGIRLWRRAIQGIADYQPGSQEHAEAMKEQIAAIVPAFEAELSLLESWGEKMWVIDIWLTRVLDLDTRLRSFRERDKKNGDLASQVSKIKSKMYHYRQAQFDDPIPADHLQAKAEFVAQALGVTIDLMTRALIAGRDGLSAAQVLSDDFTVAEEDHLGQLSFPVREFDAQAFMDVLSTGGAKTQPEISKVLRGNGALSFVLVRLESGGVEASARLEHRKDLIRGDWTVENVLRNIMPGLEAMARQQGLNVLALIDQLIQAIADRLTLTENQWQLLQLLQENIRMENTDEIEFKLLYFKELVVEALRIYAAPVLPPPIPVSSPAAGRPVSSPVRYTFRDGAYQIQATPAEQDGFFNVIMTLPWKNDIQYSEAGSMTAEEVRVYSQWLKGLEANDYASFPAFFRLLAESLVIPPEMTTVLEGESFNSRQVFLVIRALEHALRTVWVLDRQKQFPRRIIGLPRPGEDWRVTGQGGDYEIVQSVLREAGRREGLAMVEGDLLPIDQSFSANETGREAYLGLGNLTERLSPTEREIMKDRYKFMARIGQGFFHRWAYGIANALNDEDAQGPWTLEETFRGIENEIFRSARQGVPNAQAVASSSPARAVDDPEYGGIDLDPRNMDLQIRRDAAGVPLPLPQQDLQQIHIDGLYPVIFDIVPANLQAMPFLLSLADQ